jgi:hypothetical protein
MPTLRTLALTVHTCALGVWFGVLGMVGAAAAVLFPTVKALGAKTDVYAAWPVEEHWVLIAGHVGQRLFVVADAVQFACAVAAVLGLAAAAWFGHPWRGRALGVRVVLLAGALVVLAYHLLVLTPRMDTNLSQMRSLIKAGDAAGATAFKAAFDADHPVASRNLAALAALSGAAFAMAVWAGWRVSGAAPSGPGGAAA